MCARNELTRENIRMAKMVQMGIQKSGKKTVQTYSISPVANVASNLMSFPSVSGIFGKIKIKRGQHRHDRDASATCWPGYNKGHLCVVSAHTLYSERSRLPGHLHLPNPKTNSPRSSSVNLPSSPKNLSGMNFLHLVPSFVV